MARVVQWMLKLGSASVKTAVCEELCTNSVLYLQSKYASHCIKRALRNGSKTDRDHLIQSYKGHFLKLLAHTVSNSHIPNINYWCLVDTKVAVFRS